jgi:hypothetical protein
MTTFTEYFDIAHDLQQVQGSQEVWDCHAALQQAKAEIEFWRKKYLDLALEVSRRKGNAGHH